MKLDSTTKEIRGVKKDLYTLTRWLKKELPRFATKDDLKGFATKDDLKSFATKDDLKGFATKYDLKNEITASEGRLTEHVSKEIESLAVMTQNEFMTVRKQLDNIERTMNEKQETRINNLENRLFRIEDALAMNGKK